MSKQTNQPINKQPTNQLTNQLLVFWGFWGPGALLWINGIFAN